jgi:hypothetical protein
LQPATIKSPERNTSHGVFLVLIAGSQFGGQPLPQAADILGFTFPDDYVLPTD